ncbi:hypothetical protein D9M70_378580 [compost metagenome]
MIATDQHAVGAFENLHSSLRRQDSGQQAGPGRIQVLYDQESRAAVGRHTHKELRQRFEPSGGGADSYYRTTGRIRRYGFKGEIGHDGLQIVPQFPIAGTLRS